MGFVSARALFCRISLPMGFVFARSRCLRVLFLQDLVACGHCFCRISLPMGIFDIVRQPKHLAVTRFGCLQAVYRHNLVTCSLFSTHQVTNLPSEPSVWLPTDPSNCKSRYLQTLSTSLGNRSPLETYSPGNGKRMKCKTGHQFPDAPASAFQQRR